MNRILLFLSVSIVTLSVRAAEFTSLEELSGTGKAKADFTAVGGHTGRTLNASVRNLTRDTLYFFVEPGRIFLSSDTMMQDLLVVKALQEKLGPGASGSFQLTAFCCRAKKASPGKDIRFSMGPMADESWVKVAQLINRSEFPDEAIQPAVWVLSDDHAVSSVVSRPASLSLELRKMLASIKGVELPWYMVEYRKDTARVFSGQHQRVSGGITYYLRNNAVITVVVRDENGRMMSVIQRGTPRDPGDHTVNVDLRVHGWPRGMYEVFVYEDGAILNTRRRFQL